ncbi:MAG TPA: hypothetical protein VIH72_09475 [Candidatus Acidoferrales bacterium]
MNKTPPDDEFEALGISVKRRGRFTEMSSHRTPEQQAKLRKALWDVRPERLEHIRQATDELSILIRKYTSFDLVGALWLRQSIFNADEYKETESTKRPHFVEHATMLKLREPAHQVTAEFVLEAADIFRAEELLDTIFGETYAYYASEWTNPAMPDTPTKLDQLRHRSLSREIMVGPPAYPQHWEAVLEALFGAAQIDEYLREAIGFNLKQAIAFTDGIGHLMMGTLIERSSTAEKSKEEMTDQLKRYMKTAKFDGNPESKAMFDALRNMRSKERKRTIEAMTEQWVTVALSSTLAVSAETLASSAALPVEAARKFLNEFSLAYGSTSSDYFIPSPTPSLRVRPLARIPDGFFCAGPANILWAIKPRFEEALKSTSKWQAYQHHRHDILLGKALEALRKLLPDSQVHRNLFYPVAGNQKAELDGLILFDRYIFLVEAKGGDFGSGRRGGKGGIKSGLEQLVGEASDQGARASDFVRSSERPAFYKQNGEEVVIHKSKSTEVSVITITLDSLDVFTPELHLLRDVGVLGNHPLPWAVCLTDLMAISDILQSSIEFTHFLRWRRAINASGGVSSTTDELNWLAIYLKEGPKFLRVPEGFTNATFTSYTDDLDAYFYHQGGFRGKPAERPAQPIPSPLREILSSLVSRKVQGFSNVGEMLLDLTFDERSDLAATLKQRLVRPQADQNSVVFDATKLRIIVYPDERSLAEFKAGTSTNVDRRKPTLAIAVDPSVGWRVFGWLILSEGKSGDVKD